MLVKDFLFRSSQTTFSIQSHIRTAFHDETELKELLSFMIHFLNNDQSDEHTYSATFSLPVNQFGEFRSITVSQLLQPTQDIQHVVVTISMDVPLSQQTLGHFELPHLSTLVDVYDKYFQNQLLSVNVDRNTFSIIHARQSLYIVRDQPSEISVKPVSILMIPRPEVETKSDSDEKLKEDIKTKAKDASNNSTTFATYPDQDKLNLLKRNKPREWKNVEFRHYVIDEKWTVNPKSTWYTQEPFSLFSEPSKRLPLLFENNFKYVYHSNQYSYWYSPLTASIFRVDAEMYLVGVLLLVPVRQDQIQGYTQPVTQLFSQDTRGNAYMQFEGMLFRIENLRYYQAHPNFHNVSLSVRNERLIVSEVINQENGHQETVAMYEVPLQQIQDLSIF